MNNLLVYECHFYFIAILNSGEFTEFSDHWSILYMIGSFKRNTLLRNKIEIENETSAKNKVQSLIPYSNIYTV